MTIRNPIHNPIHDPVDLLKKYLTDGGLARVDSHFHAEKATNVTENANLPNEDKYLQGFQNSVQSAAVNPNLQAGRFARVSPLGAAPSSGELPLDALSAQAFAGAVPRLIPDLATQQVYRALAAMDGRPVTREEVGPVLGLMADILNTRLKDKA